MPQDESNNENKKYNWRRKSILISSDKVRETTFEGSVPASQIYYRKKKW